MYTFQLRDLVSSSRSKAGARYCATLNSRFEMEKAQNRVYVYIYLEENQRECFRDKGQTCINWSSAIRQVYIPDTQRVQKF